MTAVVTPLDDAGRQRAARCHGWLITDPLFRLLCDAQRATVTMDNLLGDAAGWFPLLGCSGIPARPAPVGLADSHVDETGQV